MKQALFSFLILTSLCGCSAWHMTNTTSEKKVIHIPYAHGDSTGEFTKRLIAEVSKQPGLRVEDSGQYLLTVKLLDSKEQKTGYRYDPLDLKKGTKKIIPNESRDLLLAEVSLKDTFTGTIILGPAYILGSVDYDHQENTIDNDINDFSLGQLSDIDTAEDVTYIPLYRDLTAKIATWLQNSCEFSSSSPQ